MSSNAGSGAENPRLPEQLGTGRLLLRLPEQADIVPFTAAIVASHPELKPWMDWAQERQTEQATGQFCAESMRSWKAGEALNLLMVEQETGEVVGSCGYPRLDWSVPWFEIGYWCRTDRVGRGYVSEATWALTRYAFEQLGAVRVELRMDDQNVRSWRVAERVGFAHEGTLRSERRAPDGSLRDTRVYAATGLAGLNRIA